MLGKDGKLCISVRRITLIRALPISSFLVGPAHPLDGEARAPSYAALVQLRRGVHNGGHQELLEVLVGVDEQVVLPG